MTTSNGSKLTLKVLTAFSDNYIYMLTWNGDAAVIDPGDADPVMFTLRDHQLHLRTILLTHYHDDHVAGVGFLKRQTDCQVKGLPAGNFGPLDYSFSDGEVLNESPLHFQVISVPGHTAVHAAFYFPEQHWVFTGDSLFLGGCGRLFEGTPEQMWESLCKLRKLPDDTQIYCGHEYTEANMRFAASLEPENSLVKERLSRVQDLRHRGRSTMPGTIGEEKLTNPFLRADDPVLRLALGMAGASDVEVFAEIRSRKDCF